MSESENKRERRWKLPFSWAVRLVVLGIVIAGVTYLVFAAKSRSLAKSTDDPRVTVTPQSIQAVQVNQSPIQAWVFADGTARSVRREYLTFERDGKIGFIKRGPDGRELRQGDQVRAGDLLARMDQRRYESEIKSAELTLAEARTQVEAALSDITQSETQHDLAATKFQRIKALFTGRAVSQSEYEEAEASYKNAIAAKGAVQAKLKALDAGIMSAEAKLDQAKLTLEETDLISPINGIIAYLNIEEGYYFTQNVVRTSSESEALQTIPIIVIDPSEFEITVDIPSYEAQRVKVGQEVLLTTGDSPPTSVFGSDTSGDTQSQIAKGRVYSVNPAVNPGGRSVQIVIRSTAGTEQLRDGMFTACWIQVESKTDAVVAPFEAFLFEENRPYVFVIESAGKGKLVARRRPVSIGIQGLNSREIISGVSAGELVATDGRYRLVDGAPVQIVDTDKSAGTP